MPDDKLTATLTEKRKRCEAVVARLAERGWTSEDDAWDQLGPMGVAEWSAGQWAQETLGLLAAVEAVLAFHQPGRIAVLGAVCKAHESYPHFSITATEADRVRDCPDCKATVCVTCTCGSGAFGQCPTRVAITAALLGEESPDAD